MMRGKGRGCVCGHNDGDGFGDGAGDGNGDGYGDGNGLEYGNGRGGGRDHHGTLGPTDAYSTGAENPHCTRTCNGDVKFFICQQTMVGL